MKSWRQKTGVFVAVSAICGLVYAFTVCPSVWWYDSGELITACYHLGIPHNPGYPLYCMLGKLFTLMVPFGSIALRVNLLSAFFGALCAGLAGTITYELTRARSLSVAGGLLFGVSGTFWSQCVVAEVYTLSAFFVCLLIYLLVRMQRGGEGTEARVVLTGLVTGLGLASHLWMVLMLPVILASLYAAREKVPGRRCFLLSFLLFAAGISLYLYLPVRSSANPVLDMGDPETLSGLFAHVSGKVHRENYIGMPLAAVVSRFARFCAMVVSEYSVAGVLAAAAGVILITAREWRVGVLLLWVVIAETVYAVLLNTVGFEVTPFGIPVFLVMALGIMFFLNWLFGKLKVSAACIPVVLLVPLAAFLLNFKKCDMSGRQDVQEYARDVLSCLPPDSVLFPEGDNNVFPLFYLRHVEGVRQDVTLVIGHDWHISWLSGRTPWLKLKESREPFTAHPWADAVIAGTEGVGFYCTNGDFANPAHLVPAGLVFKVERKPAAVSGQDTVRHDRVWEDLAARGLTPGLLRHYSVARMNFGTFFSKRNMPARAAGEYLEALLLDPENAVVHYNIGVYLQRSGMAERAMEEYLTALQLDPLHAGSAFNLAAYFQAGGELERAAGYYRICLRANPLDEEARRNLELCLSR